MITIVSGLPRSGTSLMMQILKAGGLELLADNIREADDNNPKGYYELEKVKSLMKDNSWLADAEGKVIKVIAQLIPFLHEDFEYRIIFMERNINEVVNSQNRMIDKLGGNRSTVNDEILKKTFLSQLEKVKAAIKVKGYKTVFINYNSLIESSGQELNLLNTELGLDIDIKNASQQIDKSLYRSRD